MPDPTVMVIVELPPPGAGIVLGLKLTVVPEGIPVAERLIALLNPLLRVLVMVETPWLPGATLTPEGEAERVKLGAPFAKVVPLTMFEYGLRFPAASVARTRYS